MEKNKVKAEENLENADLSTSKSVISIFNNYRLTSIVASIVAVIAILATVGILVSYEFAGPYDSEINMQITAFKDRPIHGMVLFLSCLFVIIAGVVTCYTSLPAIVNKELVQTKRSRLIPSFVACAFELIIAIMVVILLTSSEQIKTTGGFVASLIFIVLSAVANGLLILPYLRCSFYMPAIRK